MSKDTAKLIPLTNIASASVIATYKAINPNGLPQACYLLRIFNNSNQAVTVSIDGATDQEFVIAGTYINLYAQNNSGPTAQKCYWPVGTVFYVKGTAGAGNIYLSGYYN